MDTWPDIKDYFNTETTVILIAKSCANYQTKISKFDNIMIRFKVYPIEISWHEVTHLREMYENIHVFVNICSDNIGYM